MKKIMEIWERMDFTSRFGAAVITLYLLLYVVLDILEEMLGVVF